MATAVTRHWRRRSISSSPIRRSGSSGSRTRRPVAGRRAVGACVVCYAISTSRGTLVAKLDDVTIRDGWQGLGVGTSMLGALELHLRARGITRIDTACHRGNAGAWRFYERLGFRPLDEERISLLLVPPNSGLDV